MLHNNGLSAEQISVSPGMSEEMVREMLRQLYLRKRP